MCRRTEEVVGPMVGLKGRNIVCCQTKEKQNKWVFFFGLLLLPVGHPAGLDGFVGCIDLTYLRDSLTNIRIRVLSPGRASLGRMPHSPYYFL